MLSLDVTHESKSLFLRFWWQKGWLLIPDRGLSSVLKSLPNRRNLQDAIRCLRSLSPRNALWKDCPTIAWLFSTDAIRLYNIEV